MPDRPGTSSGVEIGSDGNRRYSLGLMRKEAPENDAISGSKDDSETRPTMRELGRSASSKIKQGLDWNR